MRLLPIAIAVLLIFLLLIPNGTQAIPVQSTVIPSGITGLLPEERAKALVTQLHGTKHPDLPISAHKHPVTDSMEVSANFYATNSDAWAGQAGHMHLGTDFAGNPGDNVYAPFDMKFINTSFTDDWRYWGWRINARLLDGTLFYAGHLQDVIQLNEGDLIPAGTIIGHIGRLFHTHIKLSPPGMPALCEGDGTCEDFEIYFKEH